MRLNFHNICKNNRLWRIAADKKTRGDWMALELFAEGISEWDDAVKRLVMAA